MTEQQQQDKNLKVTFWCYSPALKKGFRNVEFHSSEADARLRAYALNWQIEKIEKV